MKLAVILVHGIGGSTEAWAEPVIQKLQSKFQGQLKNILKNQAPADVSDALVIKSVYWKTALEKPQNDLQTALAKYFGWVVQSLNFWDNLFKGIYKTFYKYQNMIVTLFIGDIVGYMSKEGKLGVEAKIDEAMEALVREAKGREVLKRLAKSLNIV